MSPMGSNASPRAPAGHAGDRQQLSASRHVRRHRKLLLTGHIVVSVGMVGAGLVMVGLGISGMRGADPRTVYPAAHLIDAWVLTPLALLALGTGLLQLAAGRWNARKDWWVTIKLATTAAMAAVVALVLEPRLAAVADAAIAGRTFTDAERLPLVVAPSAAVALLIVNVALGMYKPGRRWAVKDHGPRRDVR